MSEDTGRKLLRQTLNAIAQEEYVRTINVLDSRDIDAQKAAVKMKPLVKALRILRDETRNVDGVDIYFHGDTDCAIVKVENPKRADRYRIEPSADCLLFEIEHLIDIGDRFPRINSFCNLSQDRVMDSIIELVGKHTGLLRACAEREVTYKLLVGR